MKTRVFLGNNYFGAGNFGDDLSLAGFAGAAARYPDIELTACTAHDRAGLMRRFPSIRWLPDGDAVRDDAVRNSDAWLALGDTPFQLDSGAWLLDHNQRERRRCAALAIPMYLLGVGCESREAAADPRAQALLAAAERVWTRDEFSAETLLPFTDAARLSAGADVAHLVFADGVPAPRRTPGAALLLAFERLDQLNLAELDRFVQGRAAGATRWLVQEARVLPHLERWVLERLAPESRSLLRVMDFDYATSSIEEYLSAFGAPDVTVTSRYHGALVAAWHGSKVLIIARSAKLRGISRELGLPHIDRVDSHEALEASLASAAAVPRDRLCDARDRAFAMCEAFFACCTARASRARPALGASDGAAPAMYPLSGESMAGSIEAQLPRRLHANESAVIRCAVTNCGDAVFASAAPNPIEICYRWYDARGATVGEGTWIHTPLPRPLAPQGRLEVAVVIAAPPAAGDYTLAVTLLQENVAWFDDVDPAHGVRGPVAVEPDRPKCGDDAFFALSQDDRRAMTLHAIETRTPLLMRWAAMKTPRLDAWGKRAAATAQWLIEARAVADLGCGSMVLERYLAPGQRYLPVDLVARDERTIVLDLEKDTLAGIAADAGALLGVLGYLFDPLAVLAKTRRAFPRTVVSYNVELDIEHRLSRGWVNHFDYAGLLRLFREAGLSVAREQAITASQYLFDLVPLR